MKKYHLALLVICLCSAHISNCIISSIEVHATSPPTRSTSSLWLHKHRYSLMYGMYLALSIAILSAATYTNTRTFGDIRHASKFCDQIIPSPNELGNPHEHTCHERSFRALSLNAINFFSNTTFAIATTFFGYFIFKFFPEHLL